MTTIRSANEQLQRNVHHYMRTIRSLSAGQYLQPIYEWTPRDITAHLVGWNRSYIDVIDALRMNQTPSALADPGEDFSYVNAAFVRKYGATDAVELLHEMEVSYQELARHLFTVDEEEWSRPVSVSGLCQPISIEQCVVGLSDDYVNHMHEIETWLESSPEF